MTTVYLIRHSEPLRELEGVKKSQDSLQLSNEKYILGVRGEKLAEKIASDSEFDNIDVVWASNYARAIGTAKYFAEKNNTKVNVDDRFGERVQGVVSTWDERPKDYYERQFNDENYRFKNGENQKEVVKRMQEALFEVLQNNHGKRIVIVSHHTALTFLLKSLIDVEMGNSIKEKTFTFNNKVIFTGDLDFCETFKLEFDDDLKLCSALHIDKK